MKKTMLSFVWLVAGSVLVASSMQGAITFTVDTGSGTVGTGPTDNITVSITASFDNPSYLAGCDFVLQWDSANLLCTSAIGRGVFGDGDLPNISVPGTASWTWSTAEWITNASPATVCDVTFKAAENAPLGLTTVSFTSASIALGSYNPDNALSYPADSANPFQITVVPEPINCALAVLAGGFIGVKTLRWVFRRKPSTTLGKRGQ